MPSNLISSALKQSDTAMVGSQWDRVEGIFDEDGEPSLIRSSSRNFIETASPTSDILLNSEREQTQLPDYALEDKLSLQRRVYDLEITVEALSSRCHELIEELHESRALEQKSLHSITDLNSRLVESTQEKERLRSEDELQLSRVSTRLRKAERENFLITTKYQREVNANKIANLECERLRQALIEANNDSEILLKKERENWEIEKESHVKGILSDIQREKTMRNRLKLSLQHPANDPKKEQKLLDQSEEIASLIRANSALKKEIEKCEKSPDIKALSDVVQKEIIVIKQTQLRNQEEMRMTVHNVLTQVRDERKSMTSELESMKKSVQYFVLKDKYTEPVDSDSEETITQSPPSVNRSRPSAICCTVHKLSNATVGTVQSMKNSAVSMAKSKTRKKKIPTRKLPAVTTKSTQARLNAINNRRPSSAGPTSVVWR